MIISDAVVFIVDDDPLIRDALEQLVRSVGITVVVFPSAQAFLDAELPDRPGCLVSDIRMPELSGLDLQDELNRKGITIPIIFMTGHGTVPMSVRAMKSGALDFIEKPFEDQELLDAINRAIKQSRMVRTEEAEKDAIEQCVNLLTLREHEILTLVIAGMLNKQIAYDLGMSENTVKTHRARIMRKMSVNSLAELVRSTEKIGLQPQYNSIS